jgi:hypothetical protein
MPAAASGGSDEAAITAANGSARRVADDEATRAEPPAAHETVGQRNATAQRAWTTPATRPRPALNPPASVANL